MTPSFQSYNYREEAGATASAYLDKTLPLTQVDT